MTTYNTGNAIPSNDVRDLLDNAQNLDAFSNGPLDFYADRLGVSRQSLQGIRNASQYQILGPYAAGLLFTSYNQVFSYLGEFYAPSAGLTLPYTTDGSGAPEIANFRSVGDATLRQDLLDPASGGGIVTFQRSGLSTAIRTVAEKLEEFVSPEDFGAAGDGIADDTIPIQNALDTKRRVGFPSNAYRITGSLTHYGQQVIGLGNTINSGTWSMTQLVCDGNFPAFVPAPGSPASSEIENFFIFYGDTTPVAALDNDQKIGFAFLNPTFPSPAIANPQFCKIRNCLVKGAWYAYDASGGFYLVELEKVWSWSCRFGFRQIGGTTLKLDTCYALFGEQAYYVQGCPAVTVVNCAMDQMVVTATTPQRSAAVFANIPGLNIVTFYSELNNVSVDAGSLVMFIECVGQVGSISRWRESLSSSVGTEVYGYRVFGGKMNFTALAEQVANDGFLYAGDGVVMGLLAQEGAKVTINNSDRLAAVGGTPSINYSAIAFTAAEIIANQTDLSVGANNALSLVTGVSGTFTGVLVDATVTGTPIITATYAISGKQATISVQVDPNGGTVALSAGISYIAGSPVSANFPSPANLVTSGFTGGIGRMAGDLLVLPALPATSSIFSVSSTFITS